MITQLMPASGYATAPRSATASLDEAITHAETSALNLQSANSYTKDSFVALDGFQPAAVDIQRDTAYRDVSPSGRSLHARADATTIPGQNASAKQYDALDTLAFAIGALDKAIPDLSPADQREALKARRQLDQQDPLWRSDVEIGTALAAINGGALQYIEFAEADAPGQDLSWVGNEIYANLNEALGHFSYAGNINGQSLNDVNSALATLRAIRARQ